MGSLTSDARSPSRLSSNCALMPIGTGTMSSVRNTLRCDAGAHADALHEYEISARKNDLVQHQVRHVSAQPRHPRMTCHRRTRLVEPRLRKRKRQPVDEGRACQLGSQQHDRTEDELVLDLYEVVATPQQ